MPDKRMIDTKTKVFALSDYYEYYPINGDFSAGTYICNELLYSALAKRNRESKEMPIGFIHLPYADGQKEGVPSMPLTRMVTALEIALSELI